MLNRWLFSENFKSFCRIVFLLYMSTFVKQFVCNIFFYYCKHCSSVFDFYKGKFEKISC